MGEGTAFAYVGSVTRFLQAMSALPPPAPRAEAGRALRRAGWCALALVVLWGVSQFIPSPPTAQAQTVQQSTPDQATGADLFSGGASVERTMRPEFDAGTVARNENLGRSDRATPWGRLALVALLLGGGAWWAVRMKRQRENGTLATASAHSLHTLGNLTLAPGQTVHLVSVGPDVLVVGQNAGGLTTLARYPRAEFDTAQASGDGAVYPSPSPASTPATSFADVLGGYGIRLPGGQS